MARREDHDRPIIGVTADVHVDDAGRVWFRSRVEYSDAVFRAGGAPVLLSPPPSDELLADHARACVRLVDGVVLSGGADIDTSRLDGSVRQPLHPEAKVMNARRQAFDMALLRALDEEEARSTPILGVCLGMQEMATHRGCRLAQHLADVMGSDPAERHRNDTHHKVTPAASHPVLTAAGFVASSHHQAVAEVPRESGLRVVALSEDGVIEAIEDPSRPFFLGVQWHPERTRRVGEAGGAVDALSDGVFVALVERARLRRRG